MPAKSHSYNAALAETTFPSSRQLTDSDRESFAGDSIILETNPNASRSSYVSPEVASRENRMVLYSKIAMSLVLMVGVLAMSVATYKIVSSQENKEFENQFQSMASEAIAVSREHVRTTFGTIKSFSKMISSSAIAQGSQWPNVTIPHFSSTASDLIELTGMGYVTFNVFLPDQEARSAFEEYVQPRIRPVIQEVLDYQGINQSAYDFDWIPSGVNAANRTFDTAEGTLVVTGIVEETGPGPYLVNWHRYPYEDPLSYGILRNSQSNPFVRSAFVTGNITRMASISFMPLSIGLGCQIMQPIFDGIETGNIVGMIRMFGFWGKYFRNLVNTPGDIYVVMEGSCGFTITYKLNGLQAESVGLGDHHDPTYDDQVVSGDLFTPEYDREAKLPQGVCVNDLTLRIYPSDDLKNVYTTNDPVVYAISVVVIFLFTSVVFLLYDWMVRARQIKVMKQLVREDKLLADLFPAQIRARMYNDNGSDSQDHDTRSLVSKRHVELFSEDLENPNTFKSAPLADLYLNTTIMFADIAGFTAWSSAKDPIMVFMLLETIYSAFDKMASHYGVFKVETVGDCYVAAAGVPDEREDHHVVMAKFARSCMRKMKMVTQKLEVTLGPDTGDLMLRVGLHSGQVTAGVLRGERARYQLFGDTVNTTSRIETTGVAGKIHISDFTAELLRKSGKGKCIVPRPEKVPLSGKGDMQTFFLLDSKYQRRESATKPVESMLAIEEASESSVSLREMEELEQAGPVMTKNERLVEWNTEVLSQLLQQILACRTTAPSSADKMEKSIGHGQTVLEEFQEIVVLPKFSQQDLAKRKSLQSVELASEVVNQLRDYITKVSGMYQSNAFHNFEHASHVCASVRKLLTRIVSGGSHVDSHGLVDLSGHSYGITSDPLTQFAVVFSALIHDADHPGIPNSQMIKEGNPLAVTYKQKSVAEQNSVTLCWDLLMMPDYKDLRQAIYANTEELQRFRQLVVNVVMATDIVDKELQALRKNRWNVAFSEQAPGDGHDLDVDRKATIVIEHLIQASDVSHTMQHWKIYLQWNERFFFELYRAYKEGRAETDPSIGWYKGEIGFFDFYIIPLAKKLENCGVFGVSSYEYLNYATANRDEWVRKGEEVVAGYLKKYAETESKGVRFEDDGHMSFGLNSVMEV